MNSNIQNISKALLTAAFGLFLISCNNSGTSTGVKAQDTNTGGNTTDPNVTTPPQTVLDTTAPTITSITGFETRPSTTAPIEVTVNFSEMVSGLEFSEIDTEGLVDLTAANISPVSTEMTMSYTIMVTPLDSLANGAVISLMINADAVQDGGMNGNSVSELAMTTWDDPAPTPINIRFLATNADVFVESQPGTAVEYQLRVSFDENFSLNSEAEVATFNSNINRLSGTNPFIVDGELSVRFVTNVNTGTLMLTIPANYITGVSSNLGNAEFTATLPYSL